MSDGRNPWDAEYELSIAVATQLIETQFPQLAPISTTLLGEGWDNTAYLVNEQYVFRFPRREIALALLQHENSVLPLIAACVSLAVPVPIYQGVAADDYRWPFAGYRLLIGETADRIALSDAQREMNVKAIAEFLRQLHAIDLQPIYDAGIPYDVIGRLDLGVRVPQTLDYLDKITQLYTMDVIGLRDEVAQMTTFVIPEDKCLVHGDLYAKHIIIDEQANVSGVIDWGDVHISHPAVDLMIVYSFFPARVQQQFFAIYGKVDHATKILARFLAIYLSSVLIVYGRDVNDKHLQREGLQGLTYLAASDDDVSIT